jgi:hypothetical protein
VAEAMGFLALITREVPVEIATERKKIEALLSDGVAEITRALKRALTPSVIDDSLRQEFDETRLHETAELLTTRAAELAAACSEFTAAVGSLSNPEAGATRLITKSLSLMQTELGERKQARPASHLDLRAEVRTTVAFIAVEALLSVSFSEQSKHADYLRRLVCVNRSKTTRTYQSLGIGERGRITPDSRTAMLPVASVSIFAAGAKICSVIELSILRRSDAEHSFASGQIP